MDWLGRAILGLGVGKTDWEFPPHPLHDREAGLRLARPARGQEWGFDARSADARMGTSPLIEALTDAISSLPPRTLRESSDGGSSLGGYKGFRRWHRSAPRGKPGVFLRVHFRLQGERSRPESFRECFRSDGTGEELEFP
jgi:hypothetical protein